MVLNFRWWIEFCRFNRYGCWFEFVDMSIFVLGLMYWYGFFCKRFLFLWENGEFRLMRFLLLSFNLNYFGNYRFLIYFGFLFIYIKGIVLKDLCFRIYIGFII